MQNNKSVSAGNAYHNIAEPSALIDFWGRLTTIEGTKFEAKRPWQDPYSHGYRC